MKKSKIKFNIKKKNKNKKNKLCSLMKKKNAHTTLAFAAFKYLLIHFHKNLVYADKESTWWMQGPWPREQGAWPRETGLSPTTSSK